MLNQTQCVGSTAGYSHCIPDPGHEDGAQLVPSILPLSAADIRHATTALRLDKRSGSAKTPMLPSSPCTNLPSVPQHSDSEAAPTGHVRDWSDAARIVHSLCLGLGPDSLGSLARLPRLGDREGADLLRRRDGLVHS